MSALMCWSRCGSGANGRMENAEGRGVMSQPHAERAELSPAEGSALSPGDAVNDDVREREGRASPL